MDNYERLREILDSHPSGAPKSKAFDEILRTLFTPEETDILIHMNFSPKPLEEIAEKADLTTDEAERRLEAMADRVVVFGLVKGGKKLYSLLPTIPGLFEFPFMRGKTGPALEKLGRLWEKYHAEGLGAAFAGNPTPLSRVVPVEHSLASGTSVQPYEEVKKFIEKADFIALTECACRVSVEACDKPRDVCIIFGTAGRFLVERGYAREITKDEALAVIKRADEAGLVHTTNNSIDKANLICNCCPCCCTILRGRTEVHHPHAFATSSFFARVSADDCTGCGICADERCPMEAVEIVEGVAAVNPERCIGCGLCVTGCPAAAISLVERPDKPPVPPTIRDMSVQVLTEKGKLEQFVKLMKE